MARFLISTVPLTGHVTPALPLARRLVQAGHEVCWYGGRKFQADIEATCARFLPMSPSVDFDDSDPEAAFPALRGLTRLARTKAELSHFFIRSLPVQCADLQAILQAFPADVLVADQSSGGAGLVAEIHQVPWATLGVIPLGLASRDTIPFGFGLPPMPSYFGPLRNQVLNFLILRVLFRDINAQYNQARARVGLPPRTTYFDAISPFLYMQSTASAFEYPRTDLPPQVHFIGPLLPDAPQKCELPTWWADLDAGRPVVLVTQGTLDTDPTQLILPTLQALAEKDVLVVATGGRAGDRVSLAQTPPNARVESFIPYYHLMPRVAVMVTNGGYGSVQIALAHGVPVVAAGSTEEKREVAARIAWSGVGLNLQTSKPSPAQIEAAVQLILTAPWYRQRARQLQAEFARYDAPGEAIRLLEQLAETKQPVVRGPDAAVRWTGILL